jgi:hydroxymethylpyrimidine/phosphomethylpyrimidine kinase
MKNNHPNPPVLLTIAGSDNSGGAGIQADLKTFHQHHCYGTTAITCVVAEHPGKVTRITPLEPDMVVEQIRLIIDVFPIAAFKTGMLYSQPIIEAIANELEKPQWQNIPFILDPVMVATSGTPLLEKSAIDALCARLIPKASLITPNRDEAQILWQHPITTEADLQASALELAHRYQVPFLVKGGHLLHLDAIDVLAPPQGDLKKYTAPRIPNLNPHGTGCTYSAAITAFLAHGKSLPDAVSHAKAYITAAIAKHHRHSGYCLLNHHAPIRSSTTCFQ